MPEGVPMELESRIREFISRNLLFTEDGFAYGDDASLLDEGIIDSVGVMELVNFVSTHFGLSLPIAEFRPR